MKSKESKVLIFAVFIAGLCSIVYELLIATASSYFLGDSIRQFSLTIGTYMAAMGFGSYISRMVSDENLLIKFVGFELLLGLVGGLSVPLLYAVFAYTGYYQFSSMFLTAMIGLLIGLEIPFLSRLLEQHYDLKINISNVLSVDYLGALIATLLFPFVLLPFMGTFKSSLFFGLVNMSIAIMLLWCFAEVIAVSKKKILWMYTSLSIFLLSATLIMSNVLLSEWSNDLYTDRIIYSKETPYQKVIMTKHKEDVRLYLNGNLQFSSIDEYRYHESLVHIPLLHIENVKQVLLLGGGDGLVVRELLKYSGIEHITVVDLDPAISELGKNNPNLKMLNMDSLNAGIVNVINQDAYQFLLKNKVRFDAVFIDLPDPNNASLARLYSKEFYRLVITNLSERGIFVTQATSPFFALDAYWTTFASIKAAGLASVIPYHVNVPSFGEWGFVMASKAPINIKEWDDSVPTKYLSVGVVESMMHFGKDISYKNMPPSSIDDPQVLKHYLSSWTYWN